MYRQATRECKCIIHADIQNTNPCGHLVQSIWTRKGLPVESSPTSEMVVISLSQDQPSVLAVYFSFKANAFKNHETVMICFLILFLSVWHQNHNKHDIWTYISVTC